MREKLVRAISTFRSNILADTSDPLHCSHGRERPAATSLNRHHQSPVPCHASMLQARLPRHLLSGERDVGRGMAPASQEPQQCASWTNWPREKSICEYWLSTPHPPKCRRSTPSPLSTLKVLVI